MSDAPPVQVHTVLFRPDGWVEIAYAETAELAEHVNVVRTIILDRAKFHEEIQDLEVEILELVDEGLLALRNPPDRETRTA